MRSTVRSFTIFLCTIFVSLGMHAARLTYGQRAGLCRNKTAVQLFALMEEKKTNLVLSADVTTKQELIDLIHKIGAHICVLKTHIDIIEDFDQHLIQELAQLAQQYQFLIFEDRKFADIGNTVIRQYRDGYHIADWADITNAHVVPGPGVIEGLKKVGKPKGRGLLLIAQMSSAGSLATDEYTARAVAWAREHDEFVIGFICQERLTNDPRFVHMTPGVKLCAGRDKLGQRYRTPEVVISEQGVDAIIVGRGIYQAEDPAKAAQEYRAAAWQAYKARLKQEGTT